MGLIESMNGDGKVFIVKDGEEIGFITWDNLYPQNFLNMINDSEYQQF